MEQMSPSSSGPLWAESNTIIEKVPFAREEMKRQWLLVTEAIRQEVLADPAVRSIVQSFIDQPVDEELPQKLMGALAAHPRLAQLAQRYEQELVAYLAFPAIPDKHMQPDFRHATSITLEERNRAIQRYRFARDVKLLALQAESAQHGGSIHLGEEGTATLPGGISIITHLADSPERKALLDPNNWIKRRQIKDRVYEIQVGKAQYILKEQKTNRHTDTMKTGHQPTASSQEEFEIARHYQEYAIVEGDIKANWEQPVAAVTFPDGYQFVIYEYADGLLDGRESRAALPQKILEHPEQFEAEFQEVAKLIDSYYDNKYVLASEAPEKPSALRSALIRLGFIKEERVAAPKLTFDDYAIVKSVHMHAQANDLLWRQYTKSDYADHDGSDNAFRTNLIDDKIQLEILGFDFEYFYRLDEDQLEGRKIMLQDTDVQTKRANPLADINYWSAPSTSRVQRAAYLAILDFTKKTEPREG